MSNTLQPYDSIRSNLPARRSGDTNRLVRAVEHNVLEAHGDGIINAAKVRAVEHVASEALQATASLSRQEASLMQHVPHAAGRLQFIADQAAMAMGEILIEMRRR